MIMQSLLNAVYTYIHATFIEQVVGMVVPGYVPLYSVFNIWPISIAFLYKLNNNQSYLPYYQNLQNVLAKLKLISLSPFTSGLIILY